MKIKPLQLCFSANRFDHGAKNSVNFPDNGNASTMKLRSLFFHPISHLSPKSLLLFHPFTSSSRSIDSSGYEFSIFGEVLNIVSTINPMEPALDPLVPFISPRVVTSVIGEERNRQLGFRFFIWATKKKRFCCPQTSRLVMQMLIEDNGFDLYWKTIEEIKDCGFDIASDAFTLLMRAFTKTDQAEKAFEVFGKMKEFGCEPNVYAFNTALHIIMGKKFCSLGLALYNQMLKLNCQPDVATFSILIDGLCKGAEINEALRRLDEMTERGISPNAILYNIVVSGLCQANRADKALQLISTMKEVGCRPESFTYNALLNGFCKLGRVDEALGLLRSFEDHGYVPELTGYSCLIDGLFRVRRFNEALALYGKLVVKNFKPDVVLYTILIQGLSGAGRVKDALKLKNEMIKRGVKPDTQCYNVLIKGFCDLNLLDIAQSLEVEMSKNGCLPNERTYTIFISSLCKNGGVSRAQQIFDTMEKKGCSPSVYTFNALIDGLCKAENLKEARRLFHNMEIGKPVASIRLSSWARDGSSLENTMRQLCDSGSFLEAYKIHQLSESRVAPDVTTYNILINGLCKVHDMNGAFKLCEILEHNFSSSDNVTYGTLINGLLMEGRENEALGLFYQMKKKGRTPSLEILYSLMTWSCKNKKLPLAIDLWLEHLIGLSDREEEKLKEIKENFDVGEFEKAVRDLLSMDFKLNDFNLHPYTIWLIGLCQMERVEEAFKLFCILKEFKITVTAPSCVKLIHSLCNVGNLDSAIHVFQHTLEKRFIIMPSCFKRLLEPLLRLCNDKNFVMHLLRRMESIGYNLYDYLDQDTMTLVRDHLHACEMKNVACGLISGD